MAIMFFASSAFLAFVDKSISSLSSIFLFLLPFQYILLIFLKGTSALPLNNFPKD